MRGGIASDLGDAAGKLRKNPGFTIAALGTLAIAIGDNSAIFTPAGAPLLASMPVSHPERLVEVSTLDPKRDKGKLSVPAFQLIQQEALVDSLAAIHYATLGIRLAPGRFIAHEDIGLERSVGFISGENRFPKILGDFWCTTGSTHGFEVCPRFRDEAKLLTGAWLFGQVRRKFEGQISVGLPQLNVGTVIGDLALKGASLTVK